MFSKHTLFVLLVVGVLVGPALYYNNDWSRFNSVADVGYANGSLATIPVRTPSSFDLSPNGLNQQVSTIHVASSGIGGKLNPARNGVINSPPAAEFRDNVIWPGNALGPDFNAVPLEFMPVTDLSEIFRFDANPAWVRQRWDRVSLSAGESGLSGLRVPLVTGVNASDLFGSLTYYFDSNQVAQKITFQGWTGNPNGLVQFVTKNYGFKNQPTTSAGLYVAKSWRKSTGALYMQHPNVIRSENVNQQVAILLEINNPDGSYELSTNVAAMIFNKSR